MKGPPEALQVLLPQPVAVTRRLRRVVGRAIALDRQHHPPGLGRMLGREIDPIPGAAVLGNKRDVRPGQAVTHIHLEGVELGDRRRLLAELCAVARAVLKVGAKQLNSTRVRPLRVHVSVGEGRDKGHSLLGPRYGDTETSLATVHVERPEPVEEPAVGVLAVADRKNDGVALVALHALQILDEEWLWPVFIKEIRELVVSLV